MAWTASKDREDSEAIYIVFTDAGNPASPQTLRLLKPITLAQAQDRVRDWIADHSDSGIATGTVTPAATPTPDPDNTLMQQWKDAVSNFRQAQKGVALGLFDTTSAFYTTPQADMLAIWNGATTAQKVKGLGVI